MSRRTRRMRSLLASNCSSDLPGKPPLTSGERVMFGGARRDVLTRELDFPAATLAVPTALRDDRIDGVRSDSPAGDPRDAIRATARASLGDRDDRVPPTE